MLIGRVTPTPVHTGHDAGAENWATIASLIDTCKLNVVDPLACLTSTLTAIVEDHKQSRIEELLPWNYPVKQRVQKAQWADCGHPNQAKIWSRMLGELRKPPMNSPQNPRAMAPIRP